MKNQKYSVVIASIGRSCLFATLDDISQSSEPPNEVIIVLPDDSDFVLPARYKKCDLNMRLFYGPKGQVNQRQVGLLHCNNDNIVQLDDDIRFDATVMKSLVDEVSKNPDIIVSPVFYNPNADHCITGTKVGQSRLLKFLYGANREKEVLGVGYVSAIGLAIRPSSLKDRDFISSDWLPGGCMAYNKKFSTLDSEIVNPEGKFYGEDLINSHIMKEKGAVLIFMGKLSVRMEVVSTRAIEDAILHFQSLVFIQKITHGEILYVRTVLFCMIRYLHSLLPKRA